MKATTEGHILTYSVIEKNVYEGFSPRIVESGLCLSEAQERARLLNMGSDYCTYYVRLSTDNERVEQN